MRELIRVLSFKEEERRSGTSSMLSELGGPTDRFYANSAMATQSNRILTNARLLQNVRVHRKEKAVKPRSAELDRRPSGATSANAQTDRSVDDLARLSLTKAEKLDVDEEVRYLALYPLALDEDQPPLFHTRWM